MEPRHHHGGLEGQPGLEVVYQGHLEVAYDQSLPEVRPDEYTSDGKIVSPLITKYPGHSHPGTYSTESTHAKDASQELSKPKEGWRKRKRLWLVLAGIGTVAVILIVVLGAVFGSRAGRASSKDPASQTTSSSDANNTNNPNNTASGSNTTTTTTKPQSIRQGSSLSVTGWRKPDGNVETYLFYQDPQDGLRYSRCDTSHRTTTTGGEANDSTCWEPPVRFNSYARPNTPLAASTILWGDQYQPQTVLFYSGFKTRLLGVNFNDQFSPNTSDSSINNRQQPQQASDTQNQNNQNHIFTILDGALASYWPWTLYQDASGALFHVRNLLGGNFAPSDTAWDNNPTNITAAVAGSALAVVPLSANFSRIAVKGGYAVFYYQSSSQDKDKDKDGGRLAVGITDLDSPELAADYPLSWPTEIPAIVLPRAAPMAGFSVARPGDALQRVDTYLLYRDDKNDVNVLYTSADGEEDGGRVQWKTARPDALKGVDPDTDIACLTMATSFHNAAEVEVHLEEASDATRCYFQRGGVVVEVKLDTSSSSSSKADWIVVGNVPIP
ncbi:uncharacterized protein B0T15DRAFT_578028 [Chaetomium strumarium]|uniref:Fucose-specific lectin n=1 Tax=Chaetomium strumarium TaxID=1170767 RepID=A0AAJ0GKV8_9PEZI|nr:hypothetical protein B0T15DRAFT_578028 [Chaetomium strumarium]